jgi:glycosyltransferase involved in cell wall biosynthesis
MKQDVNNQPLISIIVITYNSSRFVLETLESIKAQTYRNIELIVSDDYSKDKTIEICKKWIEENKERFVRTAFVSAESNTGVPANINRGLKASQGLWIKCLAGDDLLREDCLFELMSFISEQQDDIQILYADVVRFYGNSVDNVEIRKNQNHRFSSMESTAKEQYEMLLRFNRVWAASMIIRKDLLLSVNGFDERFRLLEDWPLWVKITEAGHKIYYLDKPLVYYRIHENNISMTADQNFLYHPVSLANISFKEKELIPRLPFIERLGLRHDIFGIKTCFFLGNNRKNPITRFAYIFFNISNPYYNYLRIRKILGKESDSIN